MYITNTTIVNIFGGPAAGKSTTAAGLFCLLKMHDIECELITEFAKDLVWEERFKALENQQYIFAKQYHKIWRLLNKVDVIITDSPLMLSVVYAQLFTPEDYIKSFIDNVIAVINSLNNLNITLNRAHNYNDSGRYQTEIRAKKVDVDIKQKLSLYNMEWTEVDADFNGINKITELVLEKLDKESLDFYICEQQ